MDRFYNVFDMQSEEMIMRNATPFIIKQTIGLDNKKVHLYAKKQFLFKDRYRIVLLEVDDETEYERRMGKYENKWCEEWDRIRKKPCKWHTISDELISQYAPVKPSIFILDKVKFITRDKIVIEFTPRKGVKVNV